METPPLSNKEREEYVGKIQELIYEIKNETVMQKNLLTVSPDTPMADVRKLLLDRRITGVPVMKDEKLLGIISISEVIYCLEENPHGEFLAKDRMALPPFPTVYHDESVVHALNNLSQSNQNRVFVLDHQEKVLGIITKGDIATGLLKQINLGYRQEEISRYRARHIFQDIESDETSLVLRYSVAPGDFTHGGEASSKIKKTLQLLNANPQDIRKIAIATYEAEINLIIHTLNGGKIIAEITPKKVTVTVVDDGPGIPDIEQAMQMGFSTTPLTIKSLGFGAGMGLPNIKRTMHEMTLTSEVGEGEGKGTTLVMALYLA